MLSKPIAGWVQVKLGDFEDRASYLTNIHVDILNALIKLKENYNPQCVVCDAEGWDYTIVFDSLDSFVILRKEEKPEFFHVDREIFEIAKEVVKDIERDFSDWNWWMYGDDEEEYENNAKELRLLLNLVKVAYHIK